MFFPESPEIEFNKRIISIEEINFTKVPEGDRATTMVFCLSLIGMFNDHVRNNDHKAAEIVYNVVNLMTQTGEKRDPVFGQRQLVHLMRRKLYPIGVSMPQSITVNVTSGSDAKEPGTAVLSILRANGDNSELK